jgi:hypothetical protein
MTKEDLYETLEQLRAEVSSLGDDAGPVKERINSLIRDLEHQVQDLDDAGHRATMHGRLATLIRHIEFEHPTITGLLERIMTGLAQMGI